MRADYRPLNGRPVLVLRRVGSAEFTGAGAVRGACARRPCAYRSEPTLRMVFFSRLRASASTWSFHRSVFHSGPRGAGVESDCAGLRPAGPESAEGQSRPCFGPPVGVALDLDMAHLLGVVDLSGDRGRYARIACVYELMLQG